MRFFANTPIVVKALFIVAVPLIMLSWAMIGEIRQAFRDEASMQTMFQAAGLSEATAALVDELQKERGMSAGFLGSGGSKFSTHLTVQQGAVVKAFSGLKGSIEQNRALIDAFPSLYEIIDHFMQDMDQLENIRQSVRKLDVAVADKLAYYIDLIDDLMQISNSIRVIYTFGADSDSAQPGDRLVVPNARFSGLLTSFMLLGRAEEAAGVERAVLSNTFGQDRFGPDMYERFVSLVSRQDHLLHEFSLQSPESIERIFSSIYGGAAVDEVDRFRKIALTKAGPGGFGVDPEQWFRISSNRIKLFRRVESEIVGRIRQYSRLGVEQAGNHVRIFLVRGLLSILIAAGLSIWVAWLLVRGIRRADQAVQAIESGAYDVPVAVEGNDEMGRMLAGVERMRLSLMATEKARAEQEKKAMARLEALKFARDELSKGRDFIERLLAAIPSILIAVDNKGAISLWNEVAEKTFGFSAKTVMNTPLASLDIGWNREAINRTLAKSEALRRCSLDNVKFRRTDGSDGFLGLTVNNVVEDGQYNGFLLIGADITERIQLESQLHLAQKMESMGELAAGIAHEINTPMQYIGDNIRFLKDGFADLLQLISSYRLALEKISQSELAEQIVFDIRQAEEDADLDFLREEAPVAVAQTLEGVAQVSKIVGAMKELSHPGTGDKMAIDINKVIENTVTVSRNEWKYVAELDLDLDPELPMIHALPEINQVFLNIIVNAAHAIEETQPEGEGVSGNIRISTCCANDVVEIRICDSGPGISKENQSKVFDPFFTTKEPGKGTGQGLAISHQIVCKRLGGRLTVESEPGHGACFIIRLPVGIES